MKIETVKSLRHYINMGFLTFAEDSPNATIHLTRSEMSQLVKTEYGIRSKKRRILYKYMKRLLNDLMRLVVEKI